MVRLNRNSIKSSTNTLGIKKGKTTSTSSESQDESNKKNIETSHVQNPNSELEKFSQFVLKTIIDENVPPTPTNFQIYFEKLLENKPLSFRKRINEYLEADMANEDEYRAKLEKDIKEGFLQIKSIMKIVGTVYKNLNIMEQIVKKRANELNVNSNQLAASNVVSVLIDDLKKLLNLTSKQKEALKQHYEKTADILKDVENKAIFDSRYGVYNKKYLFRALEKEMNSIKHYNHNSSFVMIKIKDSTLSRVVNSKEREMMVRNIAKLLLKTSRRSDVLAHYGDGIFAMIMKHTDLNSAKKACERISDLICSTSIFIGGDEIEMDVELGIMPIKPEYTIEEIIAATLDVLPKTGKNLEPYLVGSIENEEKDEEDTE